MTGEIQRVSSVESIVAQGIVQNLPEIIDALVHTYHLHKKGQLAELALKARVDELRSQKEVFIAVINSLTELSRTEGTDEETKVLLREILRDMVSSFKGNASNSQSFSDYLSGS